MYNILLFTLLFLIAAYFIARFIWIYKNYKGFLIVMASYAKLNNIEDKDIVQYCKLQSLMGLFFDMTNWQFTPYIASKAKYSEACMFHIGLMVEALGIKIDELSDKIKPNTDKDSEQK